MNGIEKLDNVTWYGHCVIHFLAALNDLPDEAKVPLCRDLERFIKRQERALCDHSESFRATSSRDASTTIDWPGPKIMHVWITLLGVTPTRLYLLRRASGLPGAFLGFGSFPQFT